MNKTYEKIFETLVYRLCFPIYLWVIGTSHFQLGVKQYEQFLPQGDGEYPVSIIYDNRREAI